MMLLMKKIFCYCACASGVTMLVHLWSKKVYGNTVRIVYLHRVIDADQPLYGFFKELGSLTSREFERRIQYLLRHFTFITLDAYMEFVRAGQPPPRNCMVLTFDDGYDCLYRNAYPILKKYGIPATLFVTTNTIGNQTVLWHDKLLYAIGTTRVIEFTLPALTEKRYCLRTESDRVMAFREIVALLKRVNRAECQQYLNSIFTALDIHENTLDQVITMLNWDQICEMISSGLLTIGAHTVSHPILTRITPEEAEQEIIASKYAIEQQINRPVHYFSYPNGRNNDYDQSIKNMVQKSGYQAAFTTMEQPDGHDLYALPRFGLENEPFYFFKLRMAGFFDFVRAMRGRKNG